MKISIETTVLCFCLGGLFAEGTFAQQTQPTYTTFDAPGAGTGANQGTFPVGIDESENIAGYYADTGFVYHGFVRASAGTIAVFHAPGAGASYPEGTFPQSINAGGLIAGYYEDANFAFHGFVRDADGAIHAREFFDDGGVFDVAKPRAAEFFGEDDAEEAHFRELGQDFLGKVRGFIPFEDVGGEFAFGKFADGLTQVLLLFGEREIHGRVTSRLF